MHPPPPPPTHAPGPADSDGRGGLAEVAAAGLLGFAAAVLLLSGSPAALSRPEPPERRGQVGTPEARPESPAEAATNPTSNAN